MQEEGFEPPRIFSQQYKQILFDTLATGIKFPAKPFTQLDFKVDLVFRLKVPKDPWISRDSEVAFDKLFKNTPLEYGQVYNEIFDYVHYLATNDDDPQKDKLPENSIITRGMTTIKSFQQPVPFNKNYFYSRKEDKQFIVDCQYQYWPYLDTFTVIYNMIMIILQKKCGFHVRTFLLQNHEDQEEKNGSAIYFLLSQSNQHLLKQADRFQIKKEVDMTDIDQGLNQPTDKKERPLKYNSIFREQPSQILFAIADKQICRLLGIKQIGITKQIFDEVEISPTEVKKYNNYYLQFSKFVTQICKKEQIQISRQEKVFIYNFNRSKINEGCLQLLAQKKRRKMVSQKIKEINKKFGYKVQSYDEAYFEFKLPKKSKPFFQKLDQLLSYRYYTINRSGQLSLFTKMERIKIAFLSIQQYFKLQNISQAGLSIFALHDNFQRFGRFTYQDKKDEGTEGAKIETLQQSWHPYLPFLTSIKSLRNYLGDNFAFEIFIKIYLINFFIIVVPLGIMSQLILQFEYDDRLDDYKWDIAELGIMVTSLSILWSIWEKKQEEYFDNFVHKYKNTIFRQGYKGPFSRNVITDEVNQHEVLNTLKQKAITFVSYLTVLFILLFQGLFFYGMRRSIVSTYKNLPIVKWQYLSLPHLIFYGVYFATNYVLYQLLFVWFIEKLVRWQNFAIQPDHDKQVTFFRYGITFGVELMGPIFFYIIEPFSGLSCYAAECTDELQNYIYARYELLFIFLFFKYYSLIWRTIKNSCSGEILQNQQDQIKEPLSVEGRINYLLRYIRSEYKRQEVAIDFREEILSVYYYVLFKIYFPFCIIFNLLLLLADYIIQRIGCFVAQRRPIPLTQALYKKQGSLRFMIHSCIVINSWTIVYTSEFLEYEFPDFLDIFVITITQENLLALKIFVTGIFIIVYEVWSYIVRKAISSLIYDPLQKRKGFMYKKYLYKVRQKPTKIQLPDTQPIKSVFRTFTYDGILQHKRQKYKIYQAYKSLRMQAFQGKRLTLFDNDPIKRPSDDQADCMNSASNLKKR